MDHRDSAMKLALELANLCSFNGLQDMDQQSCISDQFIGNGHTLAQLNDELKNAKKSQNMTECVPCCQLALSASLLKILSKSEK